MNKLKIFQSLQSIHEKVHVVFYFRGELYLVNEISDDTDKEGVNEVETAFVIGISSDGGTIVIGKSCIFECDFHMMTVVFNQGKFETNFIGITLGQEPVERLRQTFLIYRIYNQKNEIVDAGVANQMSDTVSIASPDNNLFLEEDLYNVERICRECGFRFNTQEFTI